MLSVKDISAQLQNFHWSDYVVFGTMLCACLGIGLYFNVESRRKRSNAVNYLVGNYNVAVLPVSMSLLASLTSGITLIGMPTESYLYGFDFSIQIISQMVAGVLIHYLILPVMHPLKSISLYEYLEKRFNGQLRLFGSLLYLISMIIKTPMAIYIPAMTMNQFAGTNTTHTIVLISIICITYTFLGGFKAVIWTDVLQLIILFGSIIIIAIRGTFAAGGLETVITRSLNSTRLAVPSFSLDPTMRSTFWSHFIGAIFHIIAVAAFDQSMYQRYVSLPRLKDARRALWIFIFGLSFVVLCSLYNGLLIYALYYDCDPLSTGLVQRKDQLLPHLVMNTLQNYSIVRGFFMTGIFSASLSTVSTLLNSMSAVAFQDFLKPVCGKRLTDRTIGYFLRSTVVVLGLLTMSLVFLVAKLGSVIELFMSFAGLTNGPIVGVFIIGISMPWIRTKPTLIAAIIGVLLNACIVSQIKADTAAKVLSYATKPITVEGCLYSFNETIEGPATDSDRSFYHLSYMYHTAFGTVTTILLANILCIFFGRQDSNEVLSDLLTPIVRKLLKSPNSFEMQECQVEGNVRIYKPKESEQT